MFIFGCDDITDTGLQYLKNARTLSLNDCDNVTEEAKTKLRNRGVTVYG